MNMNKHELKTKNIRRPLVKFNKYRFLSETTCDESDNPTPRKADQLQRVNIKADKVERDKKELKGKKKEQIVLEKTRRN